MRDIDEGLEVDVKVTLWPVLEKVPAFEGVTIEVEAADRTGLLRDISEVLSRERINVTATKTASSDLMAHMRFTVEIADLEQLKRVLQLIREVRGVVAARRR